MTSFEEPKYRIRISRENTTNMANTHHDFGIVDSRRRHIGAYVSTWEEDHVQVNPLNPSGPNIFWYGTPGHKFYAKVANSRNSLHYGASQRERPYNSADERAAYITKYLRDAQRRYKQKFGG